MPTSSQTLTRLLPGLAPSGGAGVAALGARAAAAVSALRCRLQGHAPELCFDQHRMYLACPACRVESPGWALGDLKAPRARFDGAPDRFDRYAWIMGRR